MIGEARRAILAISDINIENDEAEYALNYSIKEIKRNEAVREYCKHTLLVESIDERDEGLGAACKYILEILEGKT